MEQWQAALQNHQLAARLIDHLQRLDLPPVRLMEVCGTHTMAIARYALRDLMPAAITLTSGPGCPVCVTATRDIDTFIAASRIPNTIITTFGDLIRVPGSDSSLQQEIAAGRDVRVVYSPLDALDLARKNPDREVIFLGVGFETTTPTVAAAVLTAKAEKIDNFSIISSHKVMMPALAALLSDPQIRIDGLICPGHVSVVIGASAYTGLVEHYRTPCVVTGFEPLDILQGITLLAHQIANHTPKIEVAYQRAVSHQGNAKARAVIDEVFAPASAAWRGIGEIADSGLAVRDAFKNYDAVQRFKIDTPPTREPKGCRCGEVLKGIMQPPGCKLFGSGCTPGHPVGPCMVSSEGACAAFFKYDPTLNTRTES
ncbi:MAG: hydrogenase formation protein HypD [Desulfobulbaceae bacterium]|nr:hydrogenase formation protein HypD [Desulfobulbaceae bacterium]